MKLNHPGIYRVIGENFELLVNVIGEVPCLRITSGLLINDLVQKGKFTILPEESIEIQEVIRTPEKFIFSEYDYSEVCKLPSHRKSIHGTKIPDLSEDQMKEFTNKYIEDTQVSGRGIGATKAYIMAVTNFSLAQIHALCLQIAKRVHEHRKQGIGW